MGNATLQRGWKRVTVTESEAGEFDTSAQGAFEQGSTFIAAGAHFEGTLTLKGNFRIDTEFRGELETDGTITVGPQGTVVGNIRAREVVISGAVVGNVTAPRQLIVCLEEPIGVGSIDDAVSPR